MKINIIQWDIIEQNTDAIVNSANPRLSPWWWISGRIHQKAWTDLAFDLNKLIKETDLWFLETWDAIVSHWGNLLAKYIIHTVWPKYAIHTEKWKDLLAKCYISCLNIAIEKWIRTISFPSISTGIYWCPIQEASVIAINTVKNFIDQNPGIDEVRFVLLSESDYKIYQNIMS